MIFKCPCGFANYLDVMPADRRVKCEGCRKVWVVSKTGRKRRQYWDIGYLAAAMICSLLPATWPASPLLLAVLLARVVLLKQRYRPAVRLALVVLSPLIFGLVAAAAFGLVVWLVALALRGSPEAFANVGRECLTLRVVLEDWSAVGWWLFGGFVALAALIAYMPKGWIDARFAKAQEIGLTILAIVAGVGIFIFFGQDSAQDLAGPTEARIQDRYLSAKHSNEKDQRRNALLADTSAMLLDGIRPEDRVAFRGFFASDASTTDAVDLATRYLLNQNIPAGPTTQPTDARGGQGDLLWHALNLERLHAEIQLADDEEAKQQKLFQQWDIEMKGLLQNVTGPLGLADPGQSEVVKSYFKNTIDFAIDHYALSQIDQSAHMISVAICRPRQAQELDIRRTVARLYQAALIANTIETWEPNRKDDPNAPPTKTITIKNSSASVLRFWAVGPTVIERFIPPGEQQDITLDKSSYQAVLSALGGPPVVLDLQYGTGHLSGEFTPGQTWIPSGDRE